MGYAEELERYAGMGLSSSDAAMYAGGGIRPRFSEDDDEDQEVERDPDCPTTAEYEADPGKYIWIQPFGKEFQVYTYDTEAKDGYEVVKLADRQTRLEAEEFRTNYIASIQKTEYHPIGIAAVIDDIMRRFKPTGKPQ